MAKERSEFMNSSFREKLHGLPRTHQNCIEATGVARPGKTAQDRAKRERRHDDAPVKKSKKK
jgi:hypothetical protein